MGDQLYLERFVWFDHEARRERYPNAFKLGDHFEISVKTAQRSIDHFRDRLLAPLEYDNSHKGYYYTDPTFQLPVMATPELWADHSLTAPLQKAENSVQMVLTCRNAVRSGMKMELDGI
jgi:predicted DNA-binding transcriptional regulator YafY